MTALPVTPQSLAKQDGIRGIDPAVSRHWRDSTMRAFTAVVEKDTETALHVGYVPGFAEAHSQGETLDELQQNLQEVVEMLLEDEAPR